MTFAPPNPHVVLLTRDHLPDAIRVLTNAFLPDPLMRHVFDGSDATYERCLRELFRFSCEVRYLLDWPLFGSFTDGRLAGVAGVTEPGDVSWPASLTAVYDEMKAVIGLQATAHLEQYSALADTFRPRETHYHLGVIGVDSSAQGQGHGRALLDAVQQLSENHPTSIGVFLDTENPRNVTIYGRCGYEPIAQTRYGPVDLWCMFRHNRPAT